MDPNVRRILASHENKLEDALSQIYHYLERIHQGDVLKVESEINQIKEVLRTKN